MVTGSQEGFKGLRAEAVREGSDGIRGEAVSYPHPSKQREGILINSKGNHPGTPRPMVCTALDVYIISVLIYSTILRFLILVTGIQNTPWGSKLFLSKVFFVATKSRQFTNVTGLSCVFVDVWQPWESPARESHSQ